MTGCLLGKCVKNLNQSVLEKQRLKVLSFMDSCSARRRIRSLPTLFQFEFNFLHCNITSELQLLDAGHIASVKMWY